MSICQIYNTNNLWEKKGWIRISYFCHIIIENLKVNLKSEFILYRRWNSGKIVRKLVWRISVWYEYRTKTIWQINFRKITEILYPNLLWRYKLKTSFSSKTRNSSNFPIVWTGNLHGESWDRKSVVYSNLYVDGFLIGEKFSHLRKSVF
jgi:hypothetical protein